MLEHAFDIFSRAKRQKKIEAKSAAERELITQRLTGIANSTPAPSSSQTDARVERRKSPRKTVFLKAQLITKDLTFIRCHVVDLSADGARISMSADQELPRYVTLKFERSGVSKKARVAWRHKNELGLAFRVQKKIKTADEAQAPAA